jgi:hypothetical protein
MLDCYRSLEGSESPFISQSSSLVLAVSKIKDECYRGVNFSTIAENVSPHIFQTHCESALHVYCREVASSLTEILQQNDFLTKELSSLHIKVSPTQLNPSDVEIVDEGHNVFTMKFRGKDSYTLYSESKVTEENFATDRVVTCEELQAAVAQVIGDSPITCRSSFGKDEFKVLLIDIVGFENCMTNWPYLSNTALQYIKDSFSSLQVVVLNTASIDRENDGGYVPNHKMHFSGDGLNGGGKPGTNLVVELAHLEHLGQPGVGVSVLNITPHDTYQDCGPCRLQFKYV